MTHSKLAAYIFSMMAVVILLCAHFARAVEAAQNDITLHIVKPITKQKILPDTPEAGLPLAGESNRAEIQATACRGEFEPVSFVIRSKKALTDIIVEATHLIGTGGVAISNTEIDIRLVKCWYQAGTTVRKGQTVFVPELLIKDDSLVKVNDATQTNYLRVGINNQEEYIDISSSTAEFPANATIRDAKTLQPFTVPADSNKQVWITLHVPSDAALGRYKGELLVKSGNKRLKTLSLMLEVLPFDLQPPAIEYSLYYRGRLSKNPGSVINSEAKSAEQYTVELQDMRDHGVLRPVFYQPLNEMVGPALAIRNTVGLPTDKLYAMRVGTAKMENFDDESLAQLSREIFEWKKLMSQYGYKTLYVYGKDEAKAENLLEQRPAWQVVHEAGAKVYVAGYKGAVDLVGDLLDLFVLSSTFKPDEVAKWHQRGKKVFIYGNPQVGVEDAEIYRRNFGIALLCNGYDGAMDYAYQHGFGGHIWNDFDDIRDKSYRDHVFAYPTSDGVIDTVQWEGFREAVDDVRYLATLAKADAAWVYPSFCSLLESNDDLDAIRQDIITKIETTYADDQETEGDPMDAIAAPERLRVLRQGVFAP